MTVDTSTVSPGRARFTALLTPQGKIIADFIVAEAEPADGGGFFLDAPRALAPTLVQRLNFYKLRAKVLVEDLSEALGVLAIWDGSAETDYGLCCADPRLSALGMRCMLPPHLAGKAAADLGADLLEAADYEAHRIALGVPRGGLDFAYGDAFPHETDMDQLSGVDFDKGCFVGQEVVSRMEHRGIARTRVVPVRYDGFAPDAGAPVSAGEKSSRYAGLDRARPRPRHAPARSRRRCTRCGRPTGGWRHRDAARQAGLGALRFSRRREGGGIMKCGIGDSDKVHSMTRQEAIAVLVANRDALRARGVRHAALFGSVARGEAHPDSDLDILIELDPDAKIGIFEYVGIKRVYCRIVY